MYKCNACNRNFYPSSKGDADEPEEEFFFGNNEITDKAAQEGMLPSDPNKL